MAIIFNFTTGHSIFLCAEYRHLISSDYETYRILFVLYAVFFFFFRPGKGPVVLFRSVERSAVGPL